MKKVTLVVLVALAIVGCRADLDSTNGTGAAVSNDSVDFTTYVALGDSLTAGFADGALYQNGQRDSMANILATQFKLAGGGEFIQPILDDNNGGLLFGGQQILDTRLVFRGLDPETGSPILENVAEAPTTDATTIQVGPFNNLAIPAAKSFHLVAEGFGNLEGVPSDPQTANPYFVRMASSPNTTVLADAAAQQPTFFTLWIGNQDVLAYLRSGGVGDVHSETGNIDPTTYGPDDITHPDVFASVYDTLLSTLTTSANGVIVGLPDPSKTPYLSTVPYNPLPLDENQAAALNAAYAEYNQGLLAALQGGNIDQAEVDKRTINFSAGQNGVVITDEALTDLNAVGLFSYRQTTAEDSIPLTTSSRIGALVDENNPASGLGTGVAFSDEDILTVDELTQISTTNAQFNAIIQGLAANYDLAYVDINALLDELIEEGLSFNGTTVSDDFITGNAFSLDGVHLTARGYAFVANEVIRSINEKYAIAIPLVDPGAYASIYYD